MEDGGDGRTGTESSSDISLYHTIRSKSNITASISRADYRVEGRRTRAVKATSALAESTLPSSLDDLMNDDVSPAGQYGRERDVMDGNSKGTKGSNHANHRTQGKHMIGGNGPADEDEEYSVVVAANGTVVIREKAMTCKVEGAAAASDASKKRGRDDDAPVVEMEQKRPVEAKEKKRRLNLKEPGIEYKAKKAGGDVWKKGQLEPHAFIPLDARMFTKRYRQEALDHFGKVIKNTNNTRKMQNELKVKGKGKGKGRGRR